MATPWGLTCLYIGLNILKICSGHPMKELLLGSEGPNGQIMGILVAVMVSVCIVSILLVCVCCKRRSGFKVFRNSPISASVINETSLTGDDPGHVNPIANAEFTIFTPLSPPHQNNNVFRSQPINCYTENEANVSELSNKAVNPHIDGIDIRDWFGKNQFDFPRARLKYIRELGAGWFGRVVEGEAHAITPSNPEWTPVAVRILESSASAHEQALFLHEASIYRAGQHPHLLQLLGRSLEASPYLLIQEFCPKGDLKKFLLDNRECRDSEVMIGLPLQYCMQLASALQFLHERQLPHLDLATRSCQIASDLSLKLGDYGFAVSQYPNDYYQGTPSIPVRWSAPESVNHTNTTLQPKQITLEANIWSLAVTFWEICEWGRVPYDWLTDDEVVSEVMDAPHSRLPQPSLNAFYIPSLYRLMEYCWLSCQNRPQINQIYSMLTHLSKTVPTQTEMEDFDLRWESFKPNIVMKTDSTRIKSASLTNLHGSFENLVDGTNDTIIQMDSWLENVATHTGDMQYVRGLSQAIHELDTALASEQTSSSSSFNATPNSSLGPARSDTVIHLDDNLDSLIFPKKSESGSETEDETWRKRIERGAYSEKVKQKSKSVADLMVLTHIDMNTVKDIFQEELKKLQEERRESLLFVPVNINQEIEELTRNKSSENVEMFKVSDQMKNENEENQKQSVEDSSNNKNVESELKKNCDTILQGNLGSKSENSFIETNIEKQENNCLKSDQIQPIFESQNTKLENKLVDSNFDKEQQESEEALNIKTVVLNEKDISNNFDTFLHKDKSDSGQTEIEPEKNSQGDKFLEIVTNIKINESMEAKEENKILGHIQPVISVKPQELSIIQNFIDNERQENILSKDMNKTNVEILENKDDTDNNNKDNKIEIDVELNNEIVTMSQIKDTKNTLNQDDKSQINDKEKEENLIENISTECEELSLNNKTSNDEKDIVNKPNENESENKFVEEVSNENKIDNILKNVINNELINVCNKKEEDELKIRDKADISSEASDKIAEELSKLNDKTEDKLKISEDLQDSNNVNEEELITKIGDSETKFELETLEKLEERLENSTNKNMVENLVNLEIFSKELNGGDEISKVCDKNLMENKTDSSKYLEKEFDNNSDTKMFDNPENLDKFSKDVDNEIYDELSHTKKDFGKEFENNSDKRIVEDLVNLEISSEDCDNEIEDKSSNKLEEDIEIKSVIIKSEEFPLIQDFINNEKNYYTEIISTESENSTQKEDISNSSLDNLNHPDLTSNLIDASNVQQINQIFNVFNVTINHNTPLECFTNPVKNLYAHPFNQNDLITDINGLVESECQKYENKNSVCTTSLPNDFLPLVNGINSELSDKIYHFLKDETKIDNGKVVPKKLAEIALNRLKVSIEEENKEINEKAEKLTKSENDEMSEEISSNFENISSDKEDELLAKNENIDTNCKLNKKEELLKTFVIDFKIGDKSTENLEENENKTNVTEKKLEEINVSKLEVESQNEINLTKTFEESPKKLENFNEISTLRANLPDIILDNLQNKTFIKEEIPEINNLTYVEDKNILNLIVESPQKISENIDSCSSPVTSESTDNFSEKTVLEIKISDNSEEEIEPKNTEFSSNLPSSTPFKTASKNPDLNFFSFVSEGDESNDDQTRVILGPCEDYSLGLYSGLKTTFGKFSEDTPEEELLQFSSNFMPFNESTENSVDYSLETWDKFLGKSLQDQEKADFEFSPRYDSLDVFNNKQEENKELNKTIVFPDNKNDNTVVIEKDALNSTITIKESDAEQKTQQDSWEPGEGWFLHPQTVPEDLTGQIDISGADNIDNSYVGFNLDEECVNALRNELAAKLPHAQGMSLEEPQEPEDWEERNEVIVKYNVYATPLSPIPEESCCDDVYCDQIQHRDGSDSESDWSEPCLGQTSQLEDILVVDTETHTAQILESPSLREPHYRHTPSQDSCCSNDTLFNLEDLNYGHSPQHHSSSTAAQSSDEQDLVLEVEITESETPKIDTPSQEDSPKPKLELKLDPNSFSVAPLPSPEDIPWRQLPASLLTYEEVVQNDKFEIQDDLTSNDLAPENTNEDLSDSVKDCTLETDLYSNLTDIRFSGPCDTQLMSTSFSESVDFAEERDWDSGSDTRSSSSGEFIWKEGEHEESLRALHAASHDVGVIEDINPMDAIDEENSNSSEDSDDGEDEIEETEFVPSAWDAQATPTKSALRSPEKSNKRKTQQKGVWFKKQKYHCVYEYPREPESPIAPSVDLWQPLSDFSAFTDWELDPESCAPTSFDDSTDPGFDVLDKFITRSGFPLTSSTSRHRDLYQLNPFPDFTTGLSGSDEDFFISSSARPFQSISQSSQFFPGQNPAKSKFLWQDYQSSSQQSSRDLSDNITPDSGIDDITPASVSESIPIELLPIKNSKVPPLKCLAAAAANKTPSLDQKNVDSSLGGLRHTRNRLKLDLPPSPNSFSATRTFAIDVSSNDPVVNREVPTFTTFGKSRFSVQHVQTPTDDSDVLQPGKKTKNVSFEALPHKPIKLKGAVFILDKSDEKHKPVEMVQGEASLLDSADEDSGIESSANATLERHQPILN